MRWHSRLTKGSSVDSTDQWEWTDESGLAAWIQLPEASVRMWRYRGGGPKWHRIGKHVRYRRCDVEAWLAEREREAV